MGVDRRSFLSGSSAVFAGVLASTAARAAVDPVGQPSASPAGLKPVVKPGEFLDARSKTPAVITDALAAHAVDLEYSDLDPQTIEKAKHRVLDLIGCVVGGVPAAGNAALVDIVRSWGGTREASVIGYPVKGPAAQVAMANAMIARAYDFEVMTVVVQGHQVPSHHSPTTCMTALALCERAKLSGKDFLTALTVGDDIAARMLAASGLDFGQGWDGAPIYSSIAAAAITSKLMGLTQEQARDAFGLTVNTISGTVQNIWDGATDWKLPQGLAARNGIFAAELAKRNWVGIGDALLAPYGFFAQYTAGCARPEILTADLGKAFYAEEYFKPYPACAATHAYIACANRLRTKSKFSATDVAQVVVRQQGPGGFVAKPFEARRYPHCDANFSIQFQVANVILNGVTRQEHYAEDLIRSEQITDLVKKTSLAPLPPGEKGMTIEVVLKDGHSIVERHDSSYLAPSTYEEIVAKFRQQVAFSGFVSNATADEIIQRVGDLDRETNMADFARLLTRSYLPATRRA
jgi:2-methylcitrate dehydratase